MSRHGSFANWEKKQHGQCGPGHHVPYRTRAAQAVEVRCKLCKEIQVIPTVMRSNERKSA